MVTASVPPAEQRRSYAATFMGCGCRLALLTFMKLVYCAPKIWQKWNVQSGVRMQIVKKMYCLCEQLKREWGGKVCRSFRGALQSPRELKMRTFLSPNCQFYNAFQRFTMFAVILPIWWDNIKAMLLTAFIFQYCTSTYDVLIARNYPSSVSF